MRFMGTAATLLLLAVAGYSALCLGIYLFQEKLIFFPTRLAADYRYEFEDDFDEVMLPVGGASLNILHFYTAAPARGVVLYWHGNAGALHAWGTVAPFFVAQGYDVVIPDYRGYGKSSGYIRNQDTLLRDGEVVYQYVLATYAPEQIVLYGRSLGSGVATHLATVTTPSFLILEAPFYSMRDMARRQMPFVPSFLLKYPLRNDLQITEVACPVLIVHGAQDEVIPVDQGRRLASLLPLPAPFVSVEGANHNNLEQYAVYRQAVQKALSQASSTTAIQ